jgi:hypothetical protein
LLVLQNDVLKDQNNISGVAVVVVVATVVVVV